MNSEICANPLLWISQNKKIPTEQIVTWLIELRAQEGKCSKFEVAHDIFYDHMIGLTKFEVLENQENWIDGFKIKEVRIENES